MKKVFTLILAMTIVFAGFAQVKEVSRNIKKQVAQMQTFTGFEERDAADFPTQPRGIVSIVPDEAELSYTTYDWQSNMGARNFTAVWPDGYAVMCYTQATDNTYSDRGTGLAIWDPAVGEWEYTESRVEGVKTGFGSIARYKENGLVIAAHTSGDCRIFIVEDFRQGNRDFGEGIIMPTTGEDGRTYDPCWPVVQCSGENLDLIHIMTTEYSLTEPYESALLYTQYDPANNTFPVIHRILTSLDGDHISDGGSNITYFMQYDPERPNRVAFILNNAWSDCKAVISEDNGESWEERVFWQHPGITNTYEDWYFYPRWTGAAFDADDNLHVAYEYNGTTGEPGSGSYYPAIGGIGYWSEILPKNPMCLGGINSGSGFIMDTTYLMQDLYESEWYWSDANHDPLPEYIGELEIVDDNGFVISRESSEGNWPDNETWGDHGSYNGGKAAFASMYYDKPSNAVFVFWSMIAGNETNLFWDASGSQHYLRVFCNMSYDGGITWEGTKAVYDNLNHFQNALSEMAYGQVIPYLYHDSEGKYLWYCFQKDGAPGTFVQSDDANATDNLYVAVKVYVDYITDVEENNVVAPTTMTVYPNPAQGSFRMELSNEADVNIYNVAGQLVKTFQNVKDLNVNLEAGIYFVQSGDQTQKVVVF